MHHFNVLLQNFPPKLSLSKLQEFSFLNFGARASRGDDFSRSGRNSGNRELRHLRQLVDLLEPWVLKLQENSLRIPTRVVGSAAAKNASMILAYIHHADLVAFQIYDLQLFFHLDHICDRLQEHTNISNLDLLI